MDVAKPLPAAAAAEHSHANGASDGASPTMGAEAQQNGGAGPGEPTTPRGGILRVSARRSCRGATPVTSLHSSLSSYHLV